LLVSLLAAAPRVVVEAGAAWLDVRGVQPGSVHAALQRALAAAGRGLVVRSGAGVCPAVAEVAVAVAAPGELVAVAPGSERDFLRDLPLALLGVPDPLLGWLAAVGIHRCGELAVVEREAVEVRFGGSAVEWWRRSRGVDERLVFRRPSSPLPHASLDFIDYVVTDPERLLFAMNALLGSVCGALTSRGMHACRLRVCLPLADGGVLERTLRAARPTADRAVWLRLVRRLLERLTLSDAVAGLVVEVVAVEPAASVQGDLFDRGFATAAAVEAALVTVLADQGEVVRQPVAGEHPLAEVRSEYRSVALHDAVVARSPAAAVRASSAMVCRPAAAVRVASASVVDTTPAPAALPVDPAVDPAVDPVGLTLQLLAEPRRIVVETVRRRDHVVPVRYRAGRWHAVVSAAGPDRVSGGQWATSYAREYYRAVTAEGVLVWIYRDAVRGQWYLHGWWD
jgi:hypothetical protein